MSGKKISSYNQADILILGIGNILMGDEGIGVHVVRHIEKLNPFVGVKILDGGTGSFQLLEPMQTVKKVIIIDATIDGQEMGSVRLLRPKFTTDYPKTLTAHDIGLKDLLDAFHLLGDQPDVTLFAVSIKEPNGIDTEMSANLEVKVSEIAQGVIDEVRKLLT